jgi:cytochrome P450
MADSDLIPFAPPDAPLTGLKGLSTFLRNFIEAYPRQSYEQGSLRLTTRYSDTLLLCDPALIEEVLVDRPETFGRDEMTRRALLPFTGDTSLFLAEGAEWRWQRRAASPSFRHDSILSFVPIFAEMAERQVERWRGVNVTTPVKVDEAMNRVTFDVIVETMLGGRTAIDAERYRHAITQAFETIAWQSLYAMVSAPKWLPFPGKRRALRANARLRAEMARIVAARRAHPSPKPDLLDLLIAARDPETGRAMSDEELVWNLMTFLSAGHETTSVALTWTLWLIARDPELQDLLHKEVSDAVGEGPIAAPHLDQLPLCRQAIQEAMRLFPPAAVLGRQADGDVTLGEHKLTRKTFIVVPIYVLHRHERLWEQPNRFDLTRFAPAEVKARPRCTYMPFGAGPRICIGASFAMMEATVILATLLRAFRFHAPPGLKPRPVVRLSLRPAGGMPLFLEPREGARQ